MSEYFETNVQGSTGNYKVRFGELTQEEKERQGKNIGWTCTCPAFQYRDGPCKHINQVSAERQTNAQ